MNEIQLDRIEDEIAQERGVNSYTAKQLIQEIRRAWKENGEQHGIIQQFNEQTEILKDQLSQSQQENEELHLTLNRSADDQCVLRGNVFQLEKDLAQLQGECERVKGILDILEGEVELLRKTELANRINSQALTSTEKEKG